MKLLEGVGPSRARRVLDALRVQRDRPAGSDMEFWPQAMEHVPPSSREHATRVIEALIATGAGSMDETGVQVERLCDAITPLVRLHYPDGMVPCTRTSTKSCLPPRALRTFVTSSQTCARPTLIECRLHGSAAPR